MSHRPVRRCLVVFGLTIALAGAADAAQELAAHQRFAEDVLAELIGYESTADRPDEINASIAAMAHRLAEGGFTPDEVAIVSPGDGKNSLVARYAGDGDRPPLLMMAHIDVVQADPSGWSFPPFEFGKDDRWYYGRGTDDNKTGVVSLVANFVRLRAEGYRPDRDLIIVLTPDEETSSDHIEWLVTDRRDLVGAEIALNTDSGGGAYDANGEPQSFGVQTAEKVYQTFHLTTNNAGGHSSVPRADNAIYELTDAIQRIAAHRFPIMFTDTTRAGLAARAEIEGGPLADDLGAAAAGDVDAAERVAATSPRTNATLRTTCVATRLAAGHADNALPRSATATVNCRVFPGVPVDEVEARLHEIIGNAAVEITRVNEARRSPPSPLAPEIMEPIRTLAEEMWPGTPVVPVMSTGATDGLYVRSSGIPVYGLSALFGDPNDVRAHGLDERVGIAEFHDAVEYWYRLMKAFSGGR